MIIDIANQLAAIHRAVSRQAGLSGETVTVRIQREYDAEVADVWDAVTDPDRVKRWFLPLTGDLREGGTFQLEGNAGGDILTCQAPTLLRVTFGGPASVVELSLAAAGERTALELVHTVPIEMAGGSGAGALYVGPGWDGAIMGLALFLAGEEIGDPAVAANSIEVQEFSRDSAHAWAAVLRGSGTATAEEIDEGLTVSLAQFSPDV